MGEENIQKFFVYTINLCVEMALKSNVKTEGSLNKLDYLDYSMINSFSKLIAIILTTVVNITKNDLLEKICESILIVLTKFHM